ncbi:MAG TPA: M20/M25/M40 family metallo-hydrolase [Solirubrobacteraceae bacterium]|nr:M20/M25/M40 family metallo-hydrolase [Solirubrobacteraceae bacterium]
MNSPTPHDLSRVLDEARRICAVPAPTFEEAARGNLVAALFAEAVAVVERDAAGNVVAVIGDGAPESAVVFAAHLDTVFAAGTEIVFDQRDGRLAAPGIGDNSLAVAALVHLARRLRSRPLTRPVVLAATVGEEGLGDLRGVKALLDERPCAAFVAVEGQMLDSITVAAAGSVRFRVVVRGPGGHPWSDPENPSAIDALLPALSDLVPRLRDSGLVANVGVIGGGTVINAIAAEAHAELDVRSVDEAALRAASGLVQEAFAPPPAGLTVDVAELGHRPGGRIDPHHPLLSAARRARELAGLEPAPERAASTDANAAHGRGIPAITVGVTTGANAHRLDEYIDLAPLSAGLASLEALAVELAAGGAH